MIYWKYTTSDNYDVYIYERDNENRTERIIYISNDDNSELIDMKWSEWSNDTIEDEIHEFHSDTIIELSYEEMLLEMI